MAANDDEFDRQQKLALTESVKNCFVLRDNRIDVHWKEESEMDRVGTEVRCMLLSTQRYWNIGGRRSSAEDARIEAP